MHVYEYAFLCAYMYMYICILKEEYINYKLTLTCSHSKLANFTIIMNKWKVLKLSQNFEFLLSKTFLYTNYNVNYSYHYT